MDVLYIERTDILKWKEGKPRYIIKGRCDSDEDDHDSVKSVFIKVERKQDGTGQGYFEILKLHTSSRFPLNWFCNTGNLYTVPFKLSIDTGNDNPGVIDILEGQVLEYENNFNRVHFREKRAENLLDVWRSVLLTEYAELYFDGVNKKACEDEIEIIQRLNAYKRREGALTEIMKNIRIKALLTQPFHKEQEFMKADAGTGEKLSIVDRIMNVGDVFVLQGPPGTGKTKTIVDVVKNIYAKDKKAKVLLSTQDHAALEHVYDEVVKNVTEEKLLTEKDCFIIKKHGEAAESSNTEWRSDIIKKSKAMEERLGKKLEKYSAYQELLEISEIDKRIAADEAVIDRINTIFIENADTSDRQFYIRQRKAYIDDIIRLKRVKKSLLFKGIDLHEVDDEQLKTWEREYNKLKETFKIIKDWIDALTASENELCTEFPVGRRLVAATCNKIGDYNGYPQFNWVIVDEAAKVYPLDLLIAMSRGEKILLVGDHYQLPPLIEDNKIMELQEKSTLLPTEYIISYTGITEEDLGYMPFEYLYDNIPDGNKGFLDTQYRMYHAIGDFVSNVFYDKKLKTDEKTRGSNCNRLVFESFYGGKPLLWLSTSRTEERREEGKGNSYINECEADIICGEIEKLCKEYRFNSEESIIVIAGYSAQRGLIQKKIKNNKALKELYGKNIIKVGTVDAFQGQQAQVVFFSVVRSNDNNELGFLENKARLNVAFSRAKDLLVVVGDSDNFFYNKKCGQRIIERKGFVNKMKAYFDDTENESELVYL